MSVMKYLFVATFVFSGPCGAEELVRININPEKPEGLCFAKTEDPKGSSICYFIGEKTDRTRVVTEDQRKGYLTEMSALLPAKPLKVSVKCRSRVEVDTLRADGGTDSKVFCFDGSPEKKRAAFRVWFSKLRASFQESK